MTSVEILVEGFALGEASRIRTQIADTTNRVGNPDVPV
jgi:hypothetical protein